MGSGSEERGERREDVGWETVTGRRKVSSRDKARPAQAGWRLGTTFLFRNFPDGCRKEDLWFRFSEIGKVEDLFIPAKRDKLGGRFGFVRLSKGGEDEVMLEKLNKVWFGSYIIRAFIPRHERNLVTRNETGIRRSESSSRINSGLFVRPTRRVYGCSYSEALRGKDEVKKKAPPTQCDVVFQSVGEEGAWLEGAFTGQLKEEFSWGTHGEEISSECFGRLRISSLGGKLILIQSLSSLPTKDVLPGFEEWLSFWLDWARPWRSNDVNCSREVWTRWLGVPLQAWNDRFFKSGCESVGSLLELHKATKSKARLDAAFVKVAVGLENIDRTLACLINGARFCIRIEEIRPEEQVPAFAQGLSRKNYSDSYSSEDLEEEWDDVESIDAVERMTEQDGSDGEETVGGGGGDGSDLRSREGGKVGHAGATSHTDLAAALIEKNIHDMGKTQVTGSLNDPTCSFNEIEETASLGDNHVTPISTGPSRVPNSLTDDNGPEKNSHFGPQNSGPSTAISTPTQKDPLSSEFEPTELVIHSRLGEGNNSINAEAQPRASLSPSAGRQHEVNRAERRKGNRSWKKQARAQHNQCRHLVWDEFIQGMVPAEEAVSKVTKKNRKKGKKKGTENYAGRFGKETWEFGVKMGLVSSEDRVSGAGLGSLAGEGEQGVSTVAEGEQGLGANDVVSS